MSQQLVTLLLGSNLGNSEVNIETAIRYINERLGEVLKRSTMMRTLPVEYSSDRIFCNIALQISTRLSPIALLKKIKQIEEMMGRFEDSSKIGYYTDRIIDIDIVLYSNLHFESSQLVIPHSKHLYEREFSRVLLKEI